MENSNVTSTRFRDLKRTTKINIGIAVLLFALLSGLFFLVNENARLRRSLRDARTELRSLNPTTATDPAQADSVSVD